MLPWVQRVCGNEPSYSQVNSDVGSCSPKWTPKSSERDCKGQNSSPWRVLYIIAKLLKHRCLKWACIAHLDIWNTSYGQKRLGVKLAIWLPTTKSRESTRFPCVHAACNILLESSRWGYNFALDLIAIKGLDTKLCALKIAGVLVREISRLPLGSHGTKSHLDVAPVERRKVYYKGEGGGFPQVRVVLSLVCPSCPWLVLAPKVFQLCTNHFVLVLCRFVQVIEACQFFLVPSRSPSTPLYPSIMLWAKERPRLLTLPLFSVWNSHLSS
jgi:hypothetical protein